MKPSIAGYFWTRKKVAISTPIFAGQHKRCRKQKRYGPGRRFLPRRLSIDERPPIVDLRKHFGDWEGDTLKEPIPKISPKKKLLLLLKNLIIGPESVSTTRHRMRSSVKLEVVHFELEFTIF